jgi:hypothetical protein
MNCEQATAAARQRHVELVVRWLDTPEVLSYEEVQAIIGALAAESLDRFDSVVSEAVQRRHEMAGDGRQVSKDVTDASRARRIHLVVR